MLILKPWWKTDTLTFDYINNGGLDLEVTSVVFDGPFSLSTGSSMPVVTGQGAVGGFDIVFTPLADSLYIGSMVLTHNAGDPMTIPLYGYGFDGEYRESFGVVGADGYLTPYSSWTAINDGVGSDWGRASFGSGMH